MRVKPEADFQTDRSWGREGDQRPTSSAGREKGRQPSHWGDSHLPNRGWNDCFGKIIVPGENPATGTLGILSANHLPLLSIGRDMKAGKVQVGRQGAPLPKGHCTHDNPTRFFLFFQFCLCSPLGCVLKEVNTLVPWLLKSISLRARLHRHLTEPVVQLHYGAWRGAPAALLPFEHCKRSRWLTVTQQQTSLTHRHK